MLQLQPLNSVVNASIIFLNFAGSVKGSATGQLPEYAEVTFNSLQQTEEKL
jgi:hypothetical protein